MNNYIKRHRCSATYDFVDFANTGVQASLEPGQASYVVSAVDMSHIAASGAVVIVPQRVVRTEGVCGGDWRISGTRIPLWILSQYREQGKSDDDLLKEYPALKREDLSAAWSFLSQSEGAVRR